MAVRLCQMDDSTRKAAKNTLIELMLRYGYIKLDGYYRFKFHEREEFKDYPPVPMYSNWRAVQSRPKLRELAINLLADAIAQRELQFDFLSGVPMGGLWISYGLADRLEMGHLLLREPKTHGISAKIDGEFQPGQIALPTEDVTSTAESVQKTSLGLRDCGLMVPAALSIQNYDLGAVATLAKLGIDLISAIFLPDILDVGHASGIGTPKIYEIDRYFADLRPYFMPAA